MRGGQRWRNGGAEARKSKRDDEMECERESCPEILTQIQICLHKGFEKKNNDFSSVFTPGFLERLSACVHAAYGN